MRNLGALPRPKDERDVLLATAQAPVLIPSSYMPDMSWFVRNPQGDTPFCGEHGGAHFQAIIEHQSDYTINQRFSPRYGVIKLKTPTSSVYDGFPIEQGTTLIAIFKWLQKVGAASYEPLEDDVNLTTTEYIDPALVTPAIDNDANQHKIVAYAFDALDYESLCQAIYQSKAVCVLIKCDDGFWNGSQYPTFTTPTYGHFVVAYGYDPDGIWIVDSAEPNEEFAFKRINKQYLIPEFIFESGTAISALPIKSVVQETAEIVSEIPSAPVAEQPILIQLAEKVVQEIQSII